ncbi:MAG TPA: queuosine salvage family protein [Acidimicrobiales bacterium]
MTDDTDTHASTPPAAPGDPGATVFDRIRAACSTVAERATAVGLDLGALDTLAATLTADEPPLLPEERPAGDDEAMATEVVVWNAVNFGSGWFPVLRKREGLSGARSLAEALADHVAACGAPTAAWLAEADAATCAQIFGQPHPGPVDDLLELFARAWRDLGALLADGYRGSAAELVRSAGGSAGALVTTLGAMPLAHDVSRFGAGANEIEVPLYKRAQITVSHLDRAFGGQGLGRFDDVGRLTAFADNLVPHVLRMAGVLVYDDELAGRVARGELLEPGGAHEVEIRACGLYAVELLAARTGIAASSIDHQLWQRGQDAEVKAVPRHRCRCSWY